MCRAYIYIYIYIYTHTHTHTYVHICIHTQNAKPTAEQKPGAQQTMNSAMQLYFCVKFLNIIKLFLDKPVQDKHEDFIKTINYS